MGDLRVGVLSCSDECSGGAEEDVVGMGIVDACEERGWLVVAYHVCSHDAECICTSIIEMSDVDEADAILTLGGTGLEPRDVTPEATERVCERQVPGIPEHLRAVARESGDTLALSRATAGIRCSSLVINLPGGAEESRRALDVVAAHLVDAVQMLQDACAPQDASLDDVE